MQLLSTSLRMSIGSIDSRFSFAFAEDSDLPSHRLFQIDVNLKSVSSLEIASSVNEVDHTVHHRI